MKELTKKQKAQSATEKEIDARRAETLAANRPRMDRTPYYSLGETDREWFCPFCGRYGYLHENEQGEIIFPGSIMPDGDITTEEHIVEPGHAC